MWYSCCFFVKHSGRLAISILITSAQRERRNNAASINLLKLNSLSLGVLFGSAFAVHVAGPTKSFFVIVSEAIFWHLKNCVSANSLYCCWRTSGIESTEARRFSLYAIPVPTLINESSKNRLIGSNFPITEV